jgi:hypothetical protein
MADSPTAEEWIAQFAQALGLPQPDAAQITAILELASVAAHSSERRAAPVACWLAATAGVSLDDALDLARALSALNPPETPPPGPAPQGR